MGKRLCIAAFTFASVVSVVAAECQPRDYGHGSVVCVCNATYCDFIGELAPPPPGTTLTIESSKAGQRFARTTLRPSERNRSTDNDTLLLVVDPSKTYQKVFGFGGSFTDAAGINIKSLPANMQDDLLKSYFSSQGIGYTIGRIPIASCDFSARPYTYDDSPGDLELTNFTLAPEDFDLKIPYLKKAMSLSSEPIWFIASSWSSPAWMKDSNALTGPGVLKGKPQGPYYKSWAKYYIRFLQEYEKRGIPIWALTTQNEPTTGYVPRFPGQTLGFTPTTQRDFVKFDLGPALSAAGYGPGKLQIMILDDNRYVLPHWADMVLGDPDAAKYVHGVAVHWYADNIFGPWVLDKVHDRFPDRFLFATEACVGFSPSLSFGPLLGSWERAEQYAKDILEDLNHWVTGWTDWNLALNTNGGPNWIKNFVDSPMIVNETAKEFYRQPTYYALGHFSKFLQRGSVRIDSRLEEECSTRGAPSKLHYAAFKTPSSAIAVIVLNTDERKRTLRIKDLSGTGSIEKVINERSLTTFLWRS